MTLRIIDMRKPNGPEQLEQIRQVLHLGAGMEYIRELSGRQAWTKWNQTVRKIIEDVHQQGDQALIEYTRQFDNLSLTVEQLKVDPSELDRARDSADKRFMEAVRRAIDNIRSYQQRIRPSDLQWSADGVRLGICFKPVRRVGVYAPGGRAVYPSSVLMTVVPAQVAGVEEIAVCCSPGFAGKVDQNMLAVCAELGLDEVYQIGGAQAIAALAIGTDTISPVDKIVGPGGVYVQLAKRQLYGQVDIDSFAGPSEVLIIADRTARPEFIAADMLAQAEHSPGSAILLTSCRDLGKAVVEAVERRLAVLERAELTRESLERFSAVVITTSDAESQQLADELAAEHLSIDTADPEATLAGIRHAGAVFLGPYSPVAAGDYAAGPSHVLPTAATARFAAGLSATHFMRSGSVIHLSKADLAELADDIRTLADTEGLTAHRRSVDARLEA